MFPLFFYIVGSGDKLGDEGYLLDVNINRIELKAFKPAGLFYGIQTLLYSTF